MPDFMIGVILKPFALFGLAYVVLTPARRAVEKRMKEGKLKRLLLRKIS